MSLLNGFSGHVDFSVRADCGCAVRKVGGVCSLVYCPLHAAAGEMLAACKAVAKDYGDSHDWECYCGDLVNGPCGVCMANAAIKRAGAGREG